MTNAELTEHPALPPQPLDTPFPYPSDLAPDASAPSSSKAAALDFFLRATGTTSVQELEDKSKRLQEEAYAIWPYPCIRRWSFLSTKNAEHAVYDKVLELGHDPDAIYLELGCFFGTDARRLAHDGWDGRRIVGTDLRSEWFDKGYELFSDRSTCPIKFLAGDIFNSSFLSSAPTRDAKSSAALSSADITNLTSLSPLQGQLRAISAFSFFHLFEEPGQLELAKRVATLISPKKGSIIFGAHQAGVVRGDLDRGNSQDPNATRFVHSPDSWIEMWETDIFPASRSTSAEGIRVKAWAQLAQREGTKVDASSSSTMTWSVEVV